MAAQTLRPKSKGRRFGRYLFFTPLVLIAVVVAYVIFGNVVSQTGTLSVSAQSSANYYHEVGLNVLASVGSQTEVTPFTLSLTQGAYTVTFTTLEWYKTPPPRDFSVLAGKTSFAVGVYDPIPDYVAISQSQFNTTRIVALHGVTPIIWLNQMGQNVAILSDPTGLVTILPYQNSTFVFPSAGSYMVNLPQFHSANLVVDVQ